MTKIEAQEILSNNVLMFDTDDIYELPIRTIEIDIFRVSPLDKDFPVSLLGILPLTPIASDNYELSCNSFLVKGEQKYYYRYTLLDALKVIEALRVSNNYSFKQNQINDSVIYYK